MDKKDQRIAELERLLEKALMRIEELERMLGLTSKTSSKPPSSDGLRRKPSLKSLREKGQHPSGGQKGHKGHTLLKVDEPDHCVTHEASVCQACEASLMDRPIQGTIKRQVFDIPVPKIVVTEHCAEIKICACGHQTTAVFPKDVTGPVQYGPRVKALAVYLSNQQLIPEDRLQQTFEDLFALPISTATLANINRSFADQVAPIQESALEALKKADVKGADESGLRIGGKTQWLHVLCSPTLTHYRVSEKRGDLLEGLQGVLVHDHWKPYFTLGGVEHALCNAHHLRELKALEEIEKEPWAFKMSKLLRFLSRKKDLPPLNAVMNVYDAIVRQGLTFHESQPPLGSRKRGGRKRRVGHNLLIRFYHFKGAVLRFLTSPDIPFTNNDSEQDIRMVKVKQKISGCFRTSRGAEIFCTIRGFLSTQRKQGNNLFQAILNHAV